MAKSWKDALGEGTAGRASQRGAVEEALAVEATMGELAAGALARFLLERRRSEPLATAVDQVAEQLVDFDLRCEVGDVEGAVVALRAFVQRYRSYAPRGGDDR